MDTDGAETGRERGELLDVSVDSLGAFRPRGSVDGASLELLHTNAPVLQRLHGRSEPAAGPGLMAVLIGVHL
jgi:hypothetical protein